MKLTHSRGYKPGPFSCRRHKARRRINPVSATCWSEKNSPLRATVIEADTKGARLILPWITEQGETLSVSYGNRLGLYRTEKARIAWAQRLESGKTIAGIYYESEQTAAA